MKGKKIFIVLLIVLQLLSSLSFNVYAEDTDRKSFESTINLSISYLMSCEDYSEFYFTDIANILENGDCKIKCVSYKNSLHTFCI